MEDIGYSFAMGAMKAVGTVVVVLLIVTTILQFALDRFRIGFDETDNRKTGQRSNMKVFVDHGTGCEYLRVPSGEITPRLGHDGKQICRKVEE